MIGHFRRDFLNMSFPNPRKVQYDGIPIF